MPLQKVYYALLYPAGFHSSVPWRHQGPHRTLSSIRIRKDVVMNLTDAQEMTLRKYKDGLQFVQEWDSTEGRIILFLRFHELLDCNESISRNYIFATQKGMAFIDELDKRRKAKADEEKQRKENEVQRIKERKQDRRDKWLVGLTCACVGSVVTLLVEHFDKTAVFLAELFRRLIA